MLGQTQMMSRKEQTICHAYCDVRVRCLDRFALIFCVEARFGHFVCGENFGPRIFKVLIQTLSLIHRHFFDLPTYTILVNF